jgi:hypothetical protein
LLREYLAETGSFLWPVEDPSNLFFSHWNNEVEGL